MSDRKELTPDAEVTNPNDIPMDERIGTLMVVWAKNGKIAMQYPKEPHIALKMIAVLLDLLAKIENDKFKQVEAYAKEMMKQIPPGIVKAPAGSLPAFNPAFLKKHS